MLSTLIFLNVTCLNEETFITDAPLRLALPHLLARHFGTAAACKAPNEYGEKGNVEGTNPCKH